MIGSARLQLIATNFCEQPPPTSIQSVLHPPIERTAVTELGSPVTGRCDPTHSSRSSARSSLATITIFIMPKGSKKRRAIKLRKETANNHSSSTNSSGPQGDDHDSSDHALTEEEFSPRAALEAPPHHEPERETAVTEEASVVPVEHQTVSESELIGSATAVTSEVLDEPFAPLKDEEKSGDSEKASVVPVEHQTVSESELIGSATAVPSEVLDEPFAPLKDEEKSGEVSLHREETEVPESTSWAPVEQQIVSQTEAPMLPASEIFHKPFTPVEEKSGEVNLHHEQTEALEAVSRDAPTAETAPLLGRRTSWWNCCGLLDVFWGST